MVVSVEDTHNRPRMRGSTGRHGLVWNLRLGNVEAESVAVSEENIMRSGRQQIILTLPDAESSLDMLPSRPVLRSVAFKPAERRRDDVRVL